MALCDAASGCSRFRAADTREAPPGAVAMCVPPLYGSAVVEPERLEPHLAYHRQLGVGWTFLYTTAPLGPWRVPANLTLLHMVWVHGYLVWQRAQNWQINDCIHRAAARGFEWTLSIDIDEFVVLPRHAATSPPRHRHVTVTSPSRHRHVTAV